MLSPYVPWLLTEELLETSGGGEFSCTEFTGAILWIDIVDFTGITDQFAVDGVGGAESLAEILNRYFGGVIDLVDAYGGDTIRVDGDAVIALWKPEPERDDPCRYAAAAALAVRDHFHNWRPVSGVELRHRLVVTCGTLWSIRFVDMHDRRFFVVTGTPLAGLGASWLRGEPDEVIVSADVSARLAPGAEIAVEVSGALRLQALPDPAQFKVGTARHGPVPAEVQRMLRSFLPRVVVERTEAGQSAWLAEFRTLSVVYANLTGLEPDTPDIGRRLHDAVAAIQHQVSLLGIAISDLVAGEKGITAIIACGLPPYAQEENAAQAVEAARRIHPALARLGIASGIGVTTGSAFCGDVGSATRRQYMCTGPAMNYAARLMQLAGNTILCDAATVRAAGIRFSFSEAQSLQIKGRPAPLPVHRLLDAGAAPQRLAGTPSPLIGRAAEMAELDQRLAQLEGGVGGLLTIEAEAGGGKSHLLFHFSERARRRGNRTVAAAASAIEQTTAYYAFREILPELLLRPDDPVAAGGALLRTRVSEALRDTALIEKAALLNDVLPLDIAATPLAAAITGPARLSGLAELVTHIARRLTEDAPMVLLVDDFHWIDASSANLLAALVRGAPRLLMCVATRPVDTASTAHLRGLLSLAAPRLILPHLGRQAIVEMVCERLDVRAIPEALADFVHARSEGLPFYAEQLILALRDSGVLDISAGRCRLAISDLSTIALPNTLRDLVVSRIDRLPANCQLTIKVASAIGPVFAIETLRDVHPLPAGPAALGEQIGDLVGAGMLRAVAAGQAASYAFGHAIIQGIAHDLLTYAQRRTLHHRVAEHIEREWRGALEPHYAELAEHWEQADEAERANSYRLGAAELAIRRYANEDALNLVDRIDTLTARRGLRPRIEQQIGCTRIRADACQELTRFAEAGDHFRQLATLCGVRVPRSRAQMFVGLVAEATAQALRRCGIARGLSRGAAQERDQLAAHLHIRLGEHAYFESDALALAYGTLASLNRAERGRSVPDIVNACGGLALGLATVGLHRAARFYRDRSLALAADLGSLPAQGFAELLACVHSFHCGDWTRMAAHGSAGEEIWRQLGDRYRYHCCQVLQAYRLIAIGDYSAAQEKLLAFGNEAEQIESPQVRAWALAALAIVATLRGEPPAAGLKYLAAASRGTRLHRAERLLCDGIAAALYLEAGEADEALRAAEAGLASVERNSPTMAGALMFSVPSIAEVLLALADRGGHPVVDRAALLARAEAACRIARRFGARNPICRPRAELLRGRLCAARGRRRRAIAHWQRALRKAERLGMPLEQGVSRLALAGAVRRPGDREAHRGQAGAILQCLGAVSAVWVHAWGELPSGPALGSLGREAWRSKKSRSWAAE